MKSNTINMILLLLSMIIYSCSTSNKEDFKQPNIILVMADDQGWGDMGYNGHPVIKTPNFDKMASEALRFDRFYAAAPVCSPTRGSVMTGRHPNRFGCITWGRTLRPQEITIAEILKENGYVTGHFGKWHLGSVRTGSPVNPGANGFDQWFSAPNFFDNDPILSREGIAEQTTGESSMVTVNNALKFIRKHESNDKPYFAVVWFGSPHLPHQAVEQDQALYGDLSDTLKHFYGEISGMDRAFGKLREQIKTLESYENTILWYCSDNGGLPRVGSTGGRGWKASIYEGGLRVPSILEWPARIKKSGITGFPSNTSDIFPTILEITGIEPNAEVPLDGISLTSTINGQIENRVKPMGFWKYPGQGVRTPSSEWMKELRQAQINGNPVGDSSRLRLEDIEIIQVPLDSLKGHAAWLDWPWKLHRIQNRDGQILWELYNLEKDPMESENLNSSQSGIMGEMKPALEEWQKSVIRSMNGDDY